MRGGGVRPMIHWGVLWFPAGAIFAMLVVKVIAWWQDRVKDKL